MNKYIGIYISNEFISSVVIDAKNDAIFLPEDESASDTNFIFPLKVYIEDNFAYLGKEVDSLLSINSELNYAKPFIKDLDKISSYKDGTNAKWSGIMLLAMFFKKIRKGSVINGKANFKGAIITVNKSLTAELSELIRQSLLLADIPLIEIVPIENVVIHGYNVVAEPSKTKSVIVYNLEKANFSFGLVNLDENQQKETIFFEQDESIGEQILYKNIEKYVIDSYEALTKSEFVMNVENTRRLQKVVQDILNQYIAAKKDYIRTLCYFGGSALELLFPTYYISVIVNDYISLTINALKKKLELSNISIEGVDEILLTGTSKVFNVIEMYLKAIFKDVDIQVTLKDPEQIILKGLTRFTGNEREEDNLLQDDKESILPSNISDGVLRQKRLIDAIHINKGCEV